MGGEGKRKIKNGDAEQCTREASMANSVVNLHLQEDENSAQVKYQTSSVINLQREKTSRYPLKPHRLTKLCFN